MTLRPPSLCSGSQSIVTSLSLTLLMTGRPGLPGTLVPVRIYARQTHTIIFSHYTSQGTSSWRILLKQSFTVRMPLLMAIVILVRLILTTSKESVRP